MSVLGFKNKDYKDEVPQIKAPVLSQALADIDDLRLVKVLEMCVDTRENSLGNIGTYLPNLMQLKMSNSLIVSVRDLGTTLSHLQVLWMARCGLSDLDGVPSFCSLKELYLAYNDISDMSQVSMLDHLESLDLEGNNIDDITQVQYLGLCDKLSMLTLEGNPICLRPHPYTTKGIQYLLCSLHLGEQALIREEGSSDLILFYSVNGFLRWLDAIQKEREPQVLKISHSDDEEGEQDRYSLSDSAEEDEIKGALSDDWTARTSPDSSFQSSGYPSPPPPVVLNLSPSPPVCPSPPCPPGAPSGVRRTHNLRAWRLKIPDPGQQEGVQGLGQGTGTPPFRAQTGALHTDENFALLDQQNSTIEVVRPKVHQHLRASLSSMESTRPVSGPAAVGPRIHKESGGCTRESSPGRKVSSSSSSSSASPSPPPHKRKKSCRSRGYGKLVLNLSPSPPVCPSPPCPPGAPSGVRRTHNLRARRLKIPDPGQQEGVQGLGQGTGTPPFRAQTGALHTDENFALLDQQNSTIEVVRPKVHQHLRASLSSMESTRPVSGPAAVGPRIHKTAVDRSPQKPIDTHQPIIRSSVKTPERPCIPHAIRPLTAKAALQRLPNRTALIPGWGSTDSS
ncbi:UNVERIFIED_CONTAM: hypothetical protein FKN15_024460 [Acipenser sinensis]